MPRKKLNLIGKRFGRLVVIKEAGQNKNKATLWECLCDCGNTIIVIGGNLRIGCTKSCGCLKKEVIGNLNKTHDMTGTPTYRTWKSMMTRCNNKNSKSYNDYGGKGVKVCNRWLKFENFLGDMGIKPNGFSIDRIDSDGDYRPENCRWATPLTQSRNRKKCKSNPTGKKGVSFNKPSGMFRATIGIDNKMIHLGSFKTIIEAVEARRAGEIKYWGKSYG